eukprot:Hpha_TRINITY_DN8668_c0_g1::TRINITY_DN8668_c0_g1_i1::g.168653::m.168653
MAALAAGPGLQPPTGQFCKAVEAIYVLSGCNAVGEGLPAGGAAPACAAGAKGGGGGASASIAVPIVKVTKQPTEAAFRKAVHRATTPGLTSVQKSCLMGSHGGCIMIPKKDGVGKLPILSLKALGTKQ